MHELSHIDTEGSIQPLRDYTFISSNSAPGLSIEQYQHHCKYDGIPSTSDERVYINLESILKEYFNNGDDAHSLLTGESSINNQDD